MAAGDPVQLEFEAIGADKVIKELEEYISTVEDLEKVSDVDLSKMVDSLEETGSAAKSAISPLESFTETASETSTELQNTTSELDNTASGLQQFAS